MEILGESTNICTLQNLVGGQDGQGEACHEQGAGGAVREGERVKVEGDSPRQVLHPGSRKVIRQAKKMAHRSNVDSKAKVQLHLGRDSLVLTSPLGRS